MGKYLMDMPEANPSIISDKQTSTGIRRFVHSQRILPQHCNFLFLVIILSIRGGSGSSSGSICRGAWLIWFGQGSIVIKPTQNDQRPDTNDLSGHQDGRTIVQGPVIAQDGKENQRYNGTGHIADRPYHGTLGKVMTPLSSLDGIGKQCPQGCIGHTS
eukprot:scaffold1007_cov176-Amphora_coffeaeformis.AAC.34